MIFATIPDNAMTFPTESRIPTSFPERSWWSAGGLLIAGCAAMSFISGRFASHVAETDRPVIPLVVLLTVCGGVYLKALTWRPRSSDRNRLAGIFLVGMAMRLCLFFSTPMLEDDFYRYLWDGAMTANGVNPYRFVPWDIQNDTLREMPETVRRLKAEAGDILHGINYPWLRTIYPPAAQLAFGAAHVLKPWSLTAWRLILLLADLFAFALLIHCLKRTGKDLTSVAIYWWNPLLVKEIYNSAHMDVLLLPFLLAAVLLADDKRLLWAAIALGVAFGLKIWPVLMLPVLFRPFITDPRRLIPSFLLFAGIAGAMLYPFLRTRLDQTSGLAAYSQYWQMNDLFFMLLKQSASFMMGQLNMAASAMTVSRAAVAMILGVFAIFTVRRRKDGLEETTRRCCMIVAALFLLSPTQFPWYYLWMSPFLAVYRSPPLLLLTLLLPLYYLRVFFAARDMAYIHDYGVVWVEFAPVWAMLVWAWFRQMRGSTGGPSTG